MKVAPVGVWNKEEHLVLSRGGSASSVVMGGALPADVVDLTTIDNRVAKLKLSRVNFIKMHIEGAERQAPASTCLTLTRFKPRLAIACEHVDDDAHQIARLAHSLAPSTRRSAATAPIRRGVSDRS